MDAVDRSGRLQVQHVRVHDQIPAQLVSLNRWTIGRDFLRGNFRNAVLAKLVHHSGNPRLAKIREYALKHFHYRLLHVRIEYGRSHFRSLLLDLRDGDGLVDSFYFPLPIDAQKGNALFQQKIRRDSRFPWKFGHGVEPPAHEIRNGLGGRNVARLDRRGQKIAFVQTAGKQGNVPVNQRID